MSKTVLDITLEFWSSLRIWFGILKFLICFLLWSFHYHMHIQPWTVCCAIHASLRLNWRFPFPSLLLLRCIETSRSHCHWLCYVVVWKGHLILYLFYSEWTIRKLLWGQSEPEDLDLHPKDAKTEGYLVCCFREVKVICFIVHGSFLFWATMWRDQTPPVWTCPPDMYFILCPISYYYPKWHVDFRGLFICICSPSFITKN